MDTETREMLIMIKRCIRKIDDTVVPTKDMFYELKRIADALIAHLPYDKEIEHGYPTYLENL